MSRGRKESTEDELRRRAARIREAQRNGMSRVDQQSEPLPAPSRLEVIMGKKIEV